jgi:hypothetical protein
MLEVEEQEGVFGEWTRRHFTFYKFQISNTTII